MQYQRSSTFAHRRTRWLIAPLLLAVSTCTDASKPTEGTDPSEGTDPAGLPSADAVATPQSSSAVLLGAGDIAHCGSNLGDDKTATVVLDALAGDPEAVVATFGDNVYESGTAAEYANCYAPSWGQFKDRTWAALGNHEYNTGTADPSWDYFGDRAGPRGKGYYSFDHGDWHVVVLNSNSGKVPTHAGSEQEQWLRADLAASDKACTVAIFHVPRFRSSTTSTPIVPKPYVRDFWVALYEAGAELILGGDSHIYDRHAPQTPDEVPDPEFGIRQIIVGTGGKSVGLPTIPAPNSEVRNTAKQQFGVIKLTLHAASYDWEFLPAAGVTFTDQGSGTCHGAPPPALPPAELLIHEGNDQSAQVGTAVPIRPAVRVLDANGDPRPGTQINFSVIQGGGRATATSQVTDANGVARVGSWTLGPNPGPNQLRATIPNSSLAPVVFTATGTAEPPAQPAQLLIHEGNEQTAQVGTAVPIDPAVEVLDAAGAPMEGVTVDFGVTQGGGSATGTSPVTDANGIARVGSWTLGPDPGPNELQASIPGSSLAPVAFTATGTAAEPPAPAQLLVHEGDGQSAEVGTAVPISPAVRVLDANGNPLEGVAVSFGVTQGGGNATGTSPATDANGVARVGSWTLGPVAGTNQLEASIPGSSLSPVTFTATGTSAQPQPPAQLVINDGDNQSAPVGTAVPIPPSVTVLDANGTPVAGIKIQFNVTEGGGTVTGNAPLSGVDGIARVGSWTLGPVAGVNRLRARVADTQGIPVVVFVATGTSTAPPPAQLIVNDGDNQSAPAGTAVPIPPSVQVLDANGAPVANVRVEFSTTQGGGTTTGKRVVTDANGIARVGSWTLGATPGTNKLRAKLPNDPAVPVIFFTATGT